MDKVGQNQLNMIQVLDSHVRLLQLWNLQIEWKIVCTSFAGQKNKCFFEVYWKI